MKLLVVTLIMAKAFAGFEYKKAPKGTPQDGRKKSLTAKRASAGNAHETRKKTNNEEAKNYASPTKKQSQQIHALSTAGSYKKFLSSARVTETSVSSLSPSSLQLLSDLLVCGTYRLDLNASAASCGASGDMKSPPREPLAYPRGHDIMWQSYICGSWSSRMLGYSPDHPVAAAVFERANRPKSLYEQGLRQAKCLRQKKCRCLLSPFSCV